MFIPILFLASICQAMVIGPMCDYGSNSGTKNLIYNGAYVVVAPQKMRPGQTFSATVTLFAGATDSIKEQLTNNFKLYICHAKDNSTVSEDLSQQVDDVQLDIPKKVVLGEIPYSLLASEQYALCFQMTTTNKTDPSAPPVELRDSVPIAFDPKSISIFIQTDKAVYKPGKTVNFRVIVTDMDLKPYKGVIDIKLVDAGKNVLKQWNNQQLDHGVTTQLLELSEEPVLGEWSIVVKADMIETEKPFSVEKYVLPRFDVKLDVPTNVLVGDDITLSVKAMYTYGKGVKGTVKVVAQSPYGYHQRGPGPIAKLADLGKGGMTDVKFTGAELREAKLINDYGHNNIKFVATVEEALTKITRNTTGQIIVYKQKYKMDIHTAAENFKPGMEFKALIAVTLQDGSPVSNLVDLGQINLVIIQQFPYNPDTPNADINVETTQKVVLGSDGTVYVGVSTQNNATSLNLNAHLGNLLSGITAYKHMQALTSPSSTFIQLVKLDGDLKVGDDAKFNVELSEPIDRLFYDVVNRGQIVLSHFISTDSTTTLLTIPIRKSMRPQSKLIVYAVQGSNKEILVDALSFDVAGDFDNSISMSMSATNMEPFDENGVKNKVELTISTQPDSFVGILGVDQSVLLLKSGNDITRETIEQELNKYDDADMDFGGYPEPFRPIRPMMPRPLVPLVEENLVLPEPVRLDCGEGGENCRRRKRSIWFPRYLGGSDAYSVFKQSGLVVLTDALLYRGCDMRPMPMFRGAMVEDMADGGPMPDMAFANVMRKGATGGGAPPPKAAQKVVTVRSKFPETWLWLNLATDSTSSKLTYRTEVPDTITSWIVSGFSINEENGLAVVDKPSKLKVFRPFFISMNLPYSVKRGEQLAVQILVFNYGNKDQDVTVELEYDANMSKFEFVGKPGSGAAKIRQLSKQFNIRKVNVPANGGSTSVNFAISPTEIGDIPLKVRAIGSSATDGVERKLKVEPEGVTLHFNRPMLLDLTQSSNTEKQFEIGNLPKNIVDGSMFVEFSLIGDIMGPVLNNLDSLLRMPTGCGEQNMLGFVPNIIVVKYLKAVDHTDPEITAQATKYMEIGYQREQQYKHTADNSFSAFGDSDDHGSTWLTAFVVRSFKQADEFIFVDEKIITDAIGFLKEQQHENGQFEERGEVIHKDMQGGAGNDRVALTAYVLQALLQNNSTEHTASIESAQSFLEAQVQDQRIRDQPYALALVTYVLSLADSAEKSAALDMFEEKAIVEGGHKHWSGSTQEPDEETGHFYGGPQPLDVEMTAYALLTYVHLGKIAEALPIVRWLINQRNDHGGFGSTQDTVIGIQALAAYAEKAYSSDLNMQVTVNEGDKQTDMSLTSVNSIILQKMQINSVDQAITVTANGNGIGYGQFSYHYNVPKIEKKKAFDCTRNVYETEGDNRLGLSLCCKYTGSGKKSNMALVQLDSLSGYTIVREDLNGLPSTLKNLQRVETSNSDTKAAIYFNSLTNDESCLNITQQLEFPVAEQKDANIKIQDYYEPSKKVELQYNVRRKRSLEADCPDCFPDDLFVEKETPTESSVTKGSTMSQKCIDSWPRKCSRWVELFPTLCTSRRDRVIRYMKRHCRKSCKFCDT